MMEKDWKFLIENRFWNRKIRKIFNSNPIIKIFRFFDFSKNFRKKWKNRKNLDFFEIFEKFPISILKSIFDQKFSIFFHDLFLNRYRINWRSLTWRLEVLRTQCGRVKNRNVRTGCYAKKRTLKETLKKKQTYIVILQKALASGQSWRPWSCGRFPWARTISILT